MDPRYLLNSRLELLDVLSAEDGRHRDFRKGRYHLLIMHISCPTCQQVVRELQAHPDAASPLLVLNLAQDERDDPTLLAGLTRLHASQGITVSSPIPLLLELRDGVVVNVKEDFP